MKLHEISQSKGKQVVEFSDYLHNLGDVAPEHVADFKKVGTELFKLGFTYNPDQVEFYRFPEEGGVFELTLPSLGAVAITGVSGAVKRGEIQCYFYTFDEGVKKQCKRRLLAADLAGPGIVAATIDHLVASAHRVST